MTRIRQTTTAIMLGASLLGGSGAVVAAVSITGISGVAAATAIEYGGARTADRVSAATMVEYGASANAADPASVANATAIEYAL